MDEIHATIQGSRAEEKKVSLVVEPNIVAGNEAERFDIISTHAVSLSSFFACGRTRATISLITASSPGIDEDSYGENEILLIRNGDKSTEENDESKAEKRLQ